MPRQQIKRLEMSGQLDGNHQKNYPTSALDYQLQM